MAVRHSVVPGCAILDQVTADCYWIDEALMSLEVVLWTRERSLSLCLLHSLSAEETRLITWLIFSVSKHRNRFKVRLEKCKERAEKSWREKWTPHINSSWFSAPSRSPPSRLPYISPPLRDDNAVCTNAIDRKDLFHVLIWKRSPDWSESNWERYKMETSHTRQVWHRYSQTVSLTNSWWMALVFLTDYTWTVALKSYLQHL